jgi:glycosyltransferase involved in cell wall biosynthesis
MRVAIVIDGLTGVGGGITTYLRTLLPALPGAGIDATIVAGQPADDEVGTEYLVVPELDADRRSLPNDVRAGLHDALDRIRPDVCYVHVISPDATRAAAEHAPVVFYAHEYLTVCPGGSRFLTHSGTFCAEGPGLRCFVRAYTERTTNRRPDRLLHAYARVRGWTGAWESVSRLLVASEFVGNVLVGDGAPAELVDVVPYPVVPPPAPADAAPAFDVLYLGRLIEAKGVDVLLRAIARVPGATLIVAGEGPQRAELEGLAQSLDVGDRVSFVGWVGDDERARLLRAARTLALPSVWDEAFGIAGVEAMAVGTPVVASRVGGIPSWLDDGRTGLLVPRGDDEALAGALRRVLEDPQLADRLATAGIASATAYSTERHLDLLLASFERARYRDAAAASSSAERA